MEVKIDSAGGDDLPGLPHVFSFYLVRVYSTFKSITYSTRYRYCSLRNTEEEPERFRSQNYDPLWQNDKKYNLG